MKRTTKMLLVSGLLAVIGSAFAGSAVALDAEDVIADVDAAIVEFKADNKNAAAVLDAADGILVCPSMKKLGLGIGIERGTCAMRIDGETTDFYKTTSAKWGLIAGLQAHSMLIAFNDADELEKFRTSDRGFEVGVDMSVAIAQRGASGEFDLNKLTQTPVVAYVFSEKGLMYDLSLEGTTFKKVEGEYDIGRLVEVVATAQIGRKSNDPTVQLRIGIDRFVTPAERAQMIKVLRGEAEPADREPCGTIHYGGEAGTLTYAYATKVDDFNYKVTLGTREPIPFTGQWRRAVNGEGDLTVIQLNVNTDHVGTGVMLLGGEVRWDGRTEHVVLDQGRTRPIEISSVSAADRRGN